MDTLSIPRCAGFAVVFTMAQGLLGLALLALVATSVNARIHHSKVDVDDRPLIPLTDAFGFAEGGRLDLTIKNIRLFTLHDEDVSPDWDNFGLFLSPVDAEAGLEQGLMDPNKCILDDINNLVTFKDSGIQSVIKGPEDGGVEAFTYHWVVKSGGLSYLYFVNCEKDAPISFDAKIEMYNMDRKGRRDYLSVGETSLDAVFWVGPGAHTCALGRSRALVHDIHPRGNGTSAVNSHAHSCGAV